MHFILNGFRQFMIMLPINIIHKRRHIIAIAKLSMTACIVIVRCFKERPRCDVRQRLSVRIVEHFPEVAKFLQGDRLLYHGKIGFNLAGPPAFKHDGVRTQIRVFLREEAALCVVVEGKLQMT